MTLNFLAIEAVPYPFVTGAVWLMSYKCLINKQTLIHCYLLKNLVLCFKNNTNVNILENYFALGVHIFLCDPYQM